MRKHGMWKHPLYQTWNNIMQRCYDPLNPFFSDYGERGIYVDESWHDPRNFIADMKKRPKGKQLDRIDNDGPYIKENCRWATGKEQARNRRSVRKLEYKNEVRTLIEWSELYGIPHKTLYHRIVISGWPVDKALKLPVSKSNGGKMCTKERKSRYFN